MVESDIRCLFDLLKLNAQGRLPVKHIEEALPSLQATSPFFCQLLTAKLQSIHSGDLTFEEFSEALTISANPNSVADAVPKLFSLLDYEGKDTVSLSDLQRTAKTMKLDFDSGVLERMIEAADRDGDGLVTKEDLISFLGP